MDDILASIRRIIADDDVLPLSRPRAAAPGSAPAAPARPAAPPPAAATEVLRGFGQKLFRGGEPAPESTGAVTTAPMFRPPTPRVVSAGDKAPLLKLRDFAPAEAPAARPPLREAPKISAPAVAAEPAQAAPVQAEAPAEAPKEPEQKGRPAGFAPGEGAAGVAEAPRPEPAAVTAPPAAAPVAQLAEARLKAAAPASQAPAAAVEPPAAAVEPPAAAVEPAAATVESPAPPPAPVAEAPPQSSSPATRRVPAPQFKSDADEPVLLSSASGARIGASFEALAESLMLRDPEMIERIAREMLRPMLKAWLDDNLPVVVERLVRAEIERIARGRG